MAEKKVMAHLKASLLLGYKLRYEMKPLLAKMGYRFENVLFVTETALQEDEFRAVTLCWSMQFEDLPEVHESRLEKTR